MCLGVDTTIDIIYTCNFKYQRFRPKKSVQYHLSRDMRFPTMWYVWQAKPQISLRIGAVWSEPLLVAWIFYDCLATDWISFGVSKLKRRLYRLVWVYRCQNATLLEITCHCSILKIYMQVKCKKNIKPVQFCTDLIFCISPTSETTK